MEVSILMILGTTNVTIDNVAATTRLRMKANRYHVIDCTQWLPPLVLHDRHQYNGDKQATVLTSTKNNHGSYTTLLLLLLSLLLSSARISSSIF
jgi:hypothetical protein